MFRLCLDLNVWVADLLAHARGRVGTMSQTLVDVVREGTCSLGPTQLVISWGMIDRLGDVLLREFDVNGEDVRALQLGIATIAQRGPSGAAPYVLLGGTGVIPVRDTEDRGVMETALAGYADVLVTNNFRDFAGGHAVVIVPHRIASVTVGPQRLLIVIPSVMCEWLGAGRISLPKRRSP